MPIVEVGIEIEGVLTDTLVSQSHSPGNRAVTLRNPEDVHGLGGARNGRSFRTAAIIACSHLDVRWIAVISERAKLDQDALVRRDSSSRCSVRVLARLDPCSHRRLRR